MDFLFTIILKFYHSYRIICSAFHFYDLAETKFQEEVSKIVFGLPDGKGEGSCIWDPLSPWESLFDKDGNANIS